jgi:hypothetical protein
VQTKENICDRGKEARKTGVKPRARRAPQSRLLTLFYRWIISGYIYRGYRDGLRAAPKQPTA